MAGTTLKNLRPNPARAVEVNGPLKRLEAKRVLAEIKLLRKKSAQPITLYLNSGGGDVKAFYELEREFERMGEGKKSCAIITVAREARSAAAYLLVVGNAAYVLEGGQLFFHGARVHRNQKNRTLWRETAIALGMHLDRENRKIAKRLAKMVVFRIAARSSCLKNFPSQDGIQFSSPEQFIQRLAEGLGAQLKTPTAERILFESHERAKLMLALAQHFPAKATARDRQGLAPLEAEVFKATIMYEVGAHPSPEFTINPTVATEIMMDYLLARDFIRGRHHRLLRELAHGFGEELLSAEELAAYKQYRRADEAKAKAHFLKTARPYAAGLWCFALTLCHRLLSGENTFSAHDAYWLGLVDDVLPRSTATRPNS